MNHLCLSGFLITSAMRLSEKVKCDTSEHLKSLQVQLHEYLPVPESRYDWIINPFVGVDNTVFTHLISKEQDSLILL
jgi:hypothetical protein